MSYLGSCRSFCINKAIKIFAPLNLTLFKTTVPTPRQFSDNKFETGEERIRRVLMKTFPTSNCIEVVDVSGGCGAMYEITVQSPQFKSLSLVKQHKMVTSALKEEIADMHGFRINTFT